MTGLNRTNEIKIKNCLFECSKSIPITDSGLPITILIPYRLPFKPYLLRSYLLTFHVSRFTSFFFYSRRDKSRLYPKHLNLLNLTSHVLHLTSYVLRFFSFSTIRQILSTFGRQPEGLTPYVLRTNYALRVTCHAFIFSLLFLMHIVF
jgi:hypothetical protein